MIDLENFVNDTLESIELYAKEKSCAAYNGWFRSQDPDEILADIKEVLNSVVEEHETTKQRLDKAIDLLSFIKSAYIKNNEYAPLSHEEIDEVLGIGYYKNND